MIVEVDGERYDVPDDATTAEIDAISKKPSKTESFVRGAVQGGTAGFSDEMRGGIAAVAKSAEVPWNRTPGPNALAKLYPGVPYPDAAVRWFAENRPDVASAAAADKGRQAAPAAYVEARDAERAKNAAAEQANPGSYFAGGLAGAAIPTALTAPASGGAKAVTLAGKALNAARAAAPVAVQGALSGAGYSDREGLGLAADTGLGAALSLAGNAIGSGLAAGGAKAANWTAGKMGLAAGRATAAGEKAAAEAVQAANSSYGGLRQTENKAILNMLQREQSGLLTPENKAALDALKASGRVAEALNETAKNDLEFLATRIPAVQRAGMIAKDTAKAAPLIAEAETAAANKTSALPDARSWLKSYAYPFALGYGVDKAGEASGLDDSSALTIGTIAGFSRSRPGKALLSRFGKPGNAQALWGLMQKGAQGVESLGPYAGQLARAAANGPEALAAAQYVLWNTDPKFRDQVNQSNGDKGGQ